MPRGYVRKFDHDEARARHAAGETVYALAKAYGVTYKAVWFVVNPEKAAAHAEHTREWRKATCGDCGGPAQKHHYHGEYPRCHPCSRIAIATSVRDDALQCVTCREWKPDDAFPRHRRRVARRGRHDQCTACGTKTRQAYRERHKVPCVGCGKPALPPGEKGPRRGDTARCRACYVAWIREYRKTPEHSEKIKAGIRRARAAA